MADFEQYCIVELFGHQVIAGLVTEQQIGGQSFVRVDVPAVGNTQAFTKFYGAGAIYAMTPTDKDTCLAAVRSFQTRPVEEWRITRQALPEPDGEYQETDVPF